MILMLVLMLLLRTLPHQMVSGCDCMRVIGVSLFDVIVFELQYLKLLYLLLYI